MLVRIVATSNDAFQNNRDFEKIESIYVDTT